MCHMCHQRLDTSKCHQRAGSSDDDDRDCGAVQARYSQQRPVILPYVVIRSLIQHLSILFNQIFLLDLIYQICSKHPES